MALNFPLSPANGDVYSNEGTKWVYNSERNVWNSQYDVDSDIDPSGNLSIQGNVTIQGNLEASFENIPTIGSDTVLYDESNYWGVDVSTGKSWLRINGSQVHSGDLPSGTTTYSHNGLIYERGEASGDYGFVIGDMVVGGTRYPRHKIIVQNSKPSAILSNVNLGVSISSTASSIDILSKDSDGIYKPTTYTPPIADALDTIVFPVSRGKLFFMSAR